MDKKFCDKCKKEIEDTDWYYSITIWKHLDANDEEKEERTIEYCGSCFTEEFKEIMAVK